VARARAVAKKRRTVTFDDDTGDVVATSDAARLAAETEEVDNKNEEGEDMDAAEDEGDEEDLTEFLPPGMSSEGMVFKQPVEKDPQAVPVANKNFIPLFPDASKKPKLHATAIKVYKRTPPHDGFKGKVTSIEQVDEEYLSGLWGDGIYDLELIDQMGNVLRKNLGVKVAIGGGMSGGNKNEAPAGPTIDVEAIVKKVTEQSHATVELVMKKLDQERVAEREAAKQERQAEKDRNDRFIKLQSEMVTSQADQLRSHYEAGAAAAAQQTQALLTILTTGHQQMMQQVQQMNLQAQQNNNPVLLLQAFQAGLGERVDPGDKDVTTTVVDGITTGLKELRGLAEAGNKNGATKQLPSGTPTGLAKRANPGKPTTSKPAAPGALPKKEIISKEALQDILELKAAAEKRGVPFEDLIKQAKAFYVNGTVPDDMLGDDEGDEPDDVGEDEHDQGEEGHEDGDGDVAEQGNEKSSEKPAAKPADAVEGA